MLPYLHKPNYRGPSFRVLHQYLALALIGDFLLLTYLGHQPVEAPYVALGQFATIGFFGLLAAICVAAWADQWLATTSTKVNMEADSMPYARRGRLHV